MSQITASIIADSYSSVNGKRITTFELVYPRFIHSELMTHRMFSRNAMSSRAIPIEKMIDQVWSDPALPIYWGKNQAGMQAKEQLEHTDSVEIEWRAAACEAAISAKFLSEQGLHKQIVNRILEPWQLMKTVVTATEFGNWFWLRNHEDAQPEIKKLAECMYAAMQTRQPVTIKPGEWHTPYYAGGWWDENCESSLEDALAISSSCCAQVSYRLLDDSIEKAHKVYQRLVESTPVHASPFEHQATPMNVSTHNSGENAIECFQDGCTHVDRDGNFWSGNFQGYIQYRQLIPNNVKKG